MGSLGDAETGRETSLALFQPSHHVPVTDGRELQEGASLNTKAAPILSPPF